MRCTAKSKQTKKQCGRSTAKGKQTCYYHGGKSLRGVASPAYKHGRYSQVLPKNLRQRYEATKNDPELLTHEPELRLIDVRLHALLSKMEAGEKEPQLWGEVLEVLSVRRKVLEAETRRIKDSQQSMGAEQLLVLIDYLVDVIHQAVNKYANGTLARQILAQVTSDIGGLVSRSNPTPARTTRFLN